MEHIVNTKKFVFGGSCISEIDGRTVFIPFCLPEERLLVKIVKQNKKFAVAFPKEVLEPSLHRVIPKCGYFYECGGCNMQMASDEYQKTLRRIAAEEALKRAGVKNSAKTVFLKAVMTGNIVLGFSFMRKMAGQGLKSVKVKLLYL